MVVLPKGQTMPATEDDPVRISVGFEESFSTGTLTLDAVEFFNDAQNELRYREIGNWDGDFPSNVKVKLVAAHDTADENAIATADAVALGGSTLDPDTLAAPLRVVVQRPDDTEVAVTPDIHDQVVSAVREGGYEYTIASISPNSGTLGTEATIAVEVQNTSRFTLEEKDKKIVDPEPFTELGAFTAGPLDPGGTERVEVGWTVGKPPNYDGGEFAIDATVVDTDASATFTVTGFGDFDGGEDNEAPNAAFTFEGQGLVDESKIFPGEVVRFESDSFDPDGAIVRHEWDFGDGTTSTVADTEHQFDSTGNFDVTLTVTDDEGKDDTATKTVEVVERGSGGGNQAPVPAIDFDPSSPSAGDTVSFDGSGSRDPDGRVDSFEWQFEDGTTATGPTASKQYPTAGTYTVTLTVTDDGGATGQTTGTVTVGSGDGGGGTENTPPVAQFSIAASGPNPGDEIQFDAAGSEDPDGSIVSYAWDFGDGTSDSGERTSHAYESAGEFTVTLTVTDDAGATDDMSKTVTVDRTQNSAPDPEFTVSPQNQLINVGQEVTLDAAGASDPDGTIASYEWSISPGGISKTGETVSHTFSSPGTYTVALTVTDDQDKSSTGERALNVFESDDGGGNGGNGDNGGNGGNGGGGGGGGGDGGDTPVTERQALLLIGGGSALGAAAVRLFE